MGAAAATAASASAFEGDLANPPDTGSSGTAAAKLSAMAPTDAAAVDGTAAKTAGTGSRGICPFGFVDTAKIINWGERKLKQNGGRNKLELRQT